MMKIILASSVQEGNAYAREQGLMPGGFRVALRAAAIRGVRESEVHELPSFQRRLDQHAILAELRYNRGPHFIIDDGWNWPALPDEPDEPELPFDTSTTRSGVGVGVGAAVTSEPQPDAEVVAKARASTRKTAKRKAAAAPTLARHDSLGWAASQHIQDF